MTGTALNDQRHQIGIQKRGTSSTAIYESCETLVRSLGLSGGFFADVGGGRGAFTSRVKDLFDRSCLIDFKPEKKAGTDTRSADLNLTWPAQDDEFDLTCALEVIEHLENPRHFLREAVRTTKSGGHLIITTPNQVSIASKLCFLVHSQHQHFQDSCYPAHITALVPIDLQRMALELNQDDFSTSFTNSGRIPGTRLKFQHIFPFTRGQLFSDNVIFKLRVRK